MSVIQQGVQSFYNGDKVLKFGHSKQIKSMQGVMDLQSLTNWYEEDPERRHLGMMSFYGQMTKVNYGIFPDLLKDRSIIEVGSDGKFTYDVPIYEDKACTTTRDTSDQAYPGKDGTYFKIALSEAFMPGDVLTYDSLYGDDIMVTEEEVKQTGDGFEHVVQFVSQDKDSYFPAEFLASGVEYTKINHAIFGEYGTNYSSVELPDTSSYFRCEFQLGSDRGVELYLSGKAQQTFSGAAASADTLKYLSRLEEKIANWGDTALLGQMKPGTKSIDPKSVKLATTAEVLIRAELDRLSANAGLFQKPGKIDGSHGSAMFNEGLWHQARRGKIIPYSRRGGMTTSHIKEAVEYLYKDNPLPPNEREITFKCGSEMEYNFYEIFKDVANAQLESIKQSASGILPGGDGQMPKGLITGPIDNMEVNLARYGKVHIPGVGKVSVEVDYSLDYIADIAHVDRLSRGMNPYKKSHTTYSAIIWDATSQMYSNNKTLPNNATLIEDGNDKASVYMVKPEGELVISGYENGRYNPYKSSEILSSVKQRGNSFWAYSGVSYWMSDPSRVVMIELKPSARKGYN